MEELRHIWKICLPESAILLIDKSSVEMSYVEESSGKTLPIVSILQICYIFNKLYGINELR